MKPLHSVALAVGLLAASGTAPLLAQGPDVKSGSGSEERYSAEGKITVVNPFTRLVTVETKDIPGLEGKTMVVGFVAKDAKELARYKEGQQVRGELVVTEFDTYLDNVTPVQESPGSTSK